MSEEASRETCVQLSLRFPPVHGASHPVPLEWRRCLPTHTSVAAVAESPLYPGALQRQNGGEEKAQCRYVLYVITGLHNDGDSATTGESLPGITGENKGLAVGMVLLPH